MGVLKVINKSLMYSLQLTKKLLNGLQKTIKKAPAQYAKLRTQKNPKSLEDDGILINMSRAA